MNHTDKRAEFITVFGSANIDIGGIPHYELLDNDSNPGVIRITPGGVGRNIAHNLWLLGNQVKLVSAFGNDDFADRIRKSLKDTGIDIKESLMLEQESTSAYLYITEEDGNMRMAINDMDIYRHITPDFISKKEMLLKKSRYIVVDTNLPQNTVEYICKQSICPVIAESVSRAKVVKLKKILPYIHTLAGNYREAGTLTGKTIDPDDINSVSSAASMLLSEGAKRVIITLSHRGAYFADENSAKLLPAISSDKVNCTGAGDALISGVVAGYMKNLSFEESVRLGIASSSIAIESIETTNTELSFELAKERANI